MSANEQKLCAALAVFCIGISLVTLVHAGPGDVPVTTIVSDYDSGIAPALQIQSDQLGAYRNSKTQVSVIQSVGAWLLDSYPAYVRGATRHIYLGFNLPIEGSGPGGGAPTAPPSGNYQAHVIARCNNSNYNSSMLTMAPGSTITCPLIVHFDADGATYEIRMNPALASTQNTNPVNITCIFPSSGIDPCSLWKIAPSGTVVNPDGTVTYRNVGVLHKSVTIKGKTTLVKQGDFYFSFLILVSNP